MDPKRRLMLKTAGALPLVGMRPAFAEQFPSRLIKTIVAASAGTAIDVTARFVSQELSHRWTTGLIVENRPGAGGLLGYAAVAKAPPDGYTLILAGIPLYLLPLFSETPVPFDPQKDFVPVARVSRVPLAVVVGVDSPYRTLSDLISALKSKPGQLTYSSQGRGSTAHVCAAVLTDMSKTKAQHIGYSQTTGAITDVLAGRVSFTCQGSGGVLSLIQSGKLRALAVTGAARWAALPDVPTAAEQGIPGFEVSSWNDFMAPAGTPTPVLQVLSDAISRVAQTPEFAEFCRKQMIFHNVVGYKALINDVPNEAAKWKRIANAALDS